MVIISVGQLKIISPPIAPSATYREKIRVVIGIGVIVNSGVIRTVTAILITDNIALFGESWLRVRLRYRFLR